MKKLGGDVVSKKASAGPIGSSEGGSFLRVITYHGEWTWDFMFLQTSVSAGRMPLRIGHDLRQVQITNEKSREA